MKRIYDIIASFIFFFLWISGVQAISFPFQNAIPNSEQNIYHDLKINLPAIYRVYPEAKSSISVFQTTRELRYNWKI